MLNFNQSSLSDYMPTEETDSSFPPGWGVISQWLGLQKSENDSSDVAYTFRGVFQELLLVVLYGTFLLGLDYTLLWYYGAHSTVLIPFLFLVTLGVLRYFETPILKSFCNWAAIPFENVDCFRRIFQKMMIVAVCLGVCAIYSWRGTGEDAISIPRNTADFSWISVYQHVATKLVLSFATVTFIRLVMELLIASWEQFCPDEESEENKNDEGDWDVDENMNLQKPRSFIETDAVLQKQTYRNMMP